MNWWSSNIVLKLRLTESSRASMPDSVRFPQLSNLIHKLMELGWKEGHLVPDPAPIHYCVKVGHPVTGSGRAAFVEVVLFCNHLITQGFFFWRRWCYRVPESLYRVHEPLANAAVLIILEGKFCLLEYRLHSQMQTGISGDVKILPSSGFWWRWWFLFFYTIYSGCLG